MMQLTPPNSSHETGPSEASKTQLADSFANMASLVPGGALVQLLLHVAGVEEDATFMFRLGIAAALFMFFKRLRPFRVFKNWFMCSVQIEGRNRTFYAVMHYLDQRSRYRNAVLTTKFNNSFYNPPSDSPGEVWSKYTIKDGYPFFGTTLPKLRCTPAPGSNWFLYTDPRTNKQTLLYIERTFEESPRSFYPQRLDDISQYTMKLYTFGKDSRIIIPILHDMQALYTANTAGKYLKIFIPEQDKAQLAWKETSQQLRARPKETLYMDNGVLDDVLSDVRDFLLHWPFYSFHGVPYRRGHLYCGEYRLQLRYTRPSFEVGRLS